MRHTRSRSIVALAATSAAAFAALSLAGCSSSGRSTTLDPKAPVTLTWWTGQSDEPQRILQTLAKEFHKLHPNVTIKLSSGAPTTDELLQKVSAGFASGEYPDISYAYGSWVGELASSGRMLDITKEVNKPEVEWKALPEAGRRTATTADGKVVGFPAVVDSLSLIYNKKLFDKAGVAYPTNTWSWDDYRGAAKKLTDPATQVFGTAFPVDSSENTTWRLWPHLWQNGGSILDKSGKNTAFDSKAGVRSLDFLRGMAVDDKSVYLDQTGQKFEPLFVSGKIGMIPDGPWLLYDITQAHLDYGVTYLPGTNGNHATVSGPDIWALYDHKDANRSHWSYELMRWLTDAKQDARYSLALGNLPLRPDAEKELPEYKKFIAQYPGVQTMVDNTQENVHDIRPTSQGYTGLSSAIGDAISRVLQGHGSSADALHSAAKKADEALAKAR